jgi:hypothetical protein
MAPDLPARIDRATFERVLQRAAELQAASRDIGEGLTEKELLALGTEVGIPAENLRQALLEERTRLAPPAPATMVDRIFGRADVTAGRVVPGTEETVARSVSRWIERDEHFVVQRATRDRVTYEPMSAFAGALHRVVAMFDSRRSRPYLAKADLVSAGFVDLEPGFVHVTLSASIRSARRTVAAATFGMSALGVAAFVAITVMGAPAGLAAAMAAPFVVLPWWIAQLFRRVGARAKIGLERALDDLERRPALAKGSAGSEPPPGSMGSLVREMTRGMRKALKE